MEFSNIPLEFWKILHMDVFPAFTSIKSSHYFLDMTLQVLAWIYPQRSCDPDILLSFFQANIRALFLCLNIIW